ncbi:MAG: hypothetical protein CBC42_07915 [Betaproteobacteria bacterium TMED82]|nr:MAG: hypothetical protein CBC42_07915 [Betaproteobacteria bacterium TMED82]|tara:strand:- start:2187 stop:2582 length:396 start_codon:yes stop_codon:yes gene_type:complete
MLSWIKKKTGGFVDQIKLDSIALWFATRHPETPMLVMLILWLVVAYALSPIDLIPDFIPVVGLLDDLLILALAVTFAVKMLPLNVVDRCRALARQFIEKKQKEPTVILGIFLIVFLWFCIGFGFYFFFVRA